MRMAAGGWAGLLLLAACNAAGDRAGSGDASRSGDSTPTAHSWAGPDGEAADSAAVVDPYAIPCSEGGQLCPDPPPSCLDSHMAVVSSGGQCAAGLCTWHTTNVDCSVVDAGCGGSMGSDGGLVGDGAVGSTWLNVSGCLLPVPALAAPPAVACDADASPDAAVCPPPPSACADSYWLTYYDDGQCMAGVCAWQTKNHFCNLRCTAGACGAMGTVPPSTTTQ